MPKKRANPMPESNAKLDYVEFGNTLRVLIKAKGYTQANFAEAIGVAYSTMMNILQGRRRIYIHTYLKIIDVLDISDVLLLNQTIPNDELRQTADLYVQFLPLLRKLPKPALNSFIDLAKEMIKDTEEKN